jgi:rhamnogalacturonyl hydrolase YesR
MGMLKGILTIALFCTTLLCHAQKYVNTSLTKNVGHNAESYRSISFDGAWCWFSDPRAIYFEGKFKRTYVGWVNSYGDIMIGYYDHDTKKIGTHLLYDNLEIDDHNNPALIFDNEGRLMVFFSKHSKNFPIQLMKAKHPEDIKEWESVSELPLNDMIAYKGFRDSYTYQNIVYLSSEDKFYLFWRGADFKPNYSVSEDGGRTWSKGKIFVLPERLYANRRPYLKVYSNGENKIHFAFTDGHPNVEQQNSIYYMYYQNGAYYRTNGEKIKNIGDGPVDPKETSKVYEALPAQNPKSWIWDIAEDKSGNPVVVYAKFPNDTTHVYSYAYFDRGNWQNLDLINSGSWFPKTPAGEVERETYYSGGMSIDKEDPSIIYLSVKRDSVFEIEKWVTKNKGKKWTVEAITKGSSKDNIRPFAVLNAAENNPNQVLWMTNTHYRHYSDYHSSIKADLKPVSVVADLDSSAIVDVMHKVADWQLANPVKHHILDWHYGAFYTGIMALYEVTGEHRYLNEMINIGQKHNWKLIDDIYHADRLTIAQVYADLYKITKGPVMLDKTQWAMDIHVGRRPKADVTFENNPYRLEWWTWCDALYMAPPAFAKVFAITSDTKYLKYMDEHWWKTSDYLYSKADSLYYRDDRFFNQKSKHGKSVFWGRGNGWVIAGLARVIPYIPNDYPSREKFVQQYKEMAYKLLSIQGEDGMWRASLLDPEELPIGESSGTSFFAYALTWGINYGLLDRQLFQPAVEKAWRALVNNVSDQGRLGYVQQVAGSPYEFYDYQSHVYASGAFLLLGKEMLGLLGDSRINP